MMHDTYFLPEATERRLQSRQRVLRSGLVTYWDGARSFGCTIRNVTAEGARISKPRSQPLPASLFLISLRRRVVHEAKVVWSNSNEAGLTFVRSSQLSELTDPKFNYLRRLSNSAIH